MPKKIGDAPAKKRKNKSEGADSGPKTDKGWAVAQRAVAAFHAKDFEKALPLLEKAAELNPRSANILTKLARALLMMNQAEKAALVYRRVLEVKPDHAQARLMVGRADWREGRRDEALVNMAAGRAGEGEGDPKQIVRMGQLYFRQWRVEEAEASFNRVLQIEPGNFTALVGLARCAGMGGDRDEALRLLRAATASRPGEPKIEEWIKRLEAEPAQHDWNKEVQEAATVLGDADAEAGARLWAGRQLLSYGVTDIVLKTFGEKEGESPSTRRLVQMARQLDKSGLSQPLRAAGVAAEAEVEELNRLNGVVERLRPGADTLVLVFAGLMNRAFLSLDILHRLLRGSGASLVYCRDLERTYYRGGIVGLGADFATTVEGFAKLRERAGAGRVLTLGNCIGCDAALRYGLALGAEAMLGISPRAGAKAEQILPDSTKAKLEALLRSAPRYAGDLVEMYRAAGADAPRVSLVAGAGAEPEASFAREMGERVPGVVYAAMPGVYRECFGDILARGLLRPLLEGFVADGGIHPEVLRALRQAEPDGDQPFAASSEARANA